MADRYNTNNPIGSYDPKDIHDNAIILDQYINSETEFVIDRLGNERLTLFGVAQSTGTIGGDSGGDTGGDSGGDTGGDTGGGMAAPVEITEEEYYKSAEAGVLYAVSPKADRTVNLGQPQSVSGESIISASQSGGVLPS